MAARSARGQKGPKRPPMTEEEKRLHAEMVRLKAEDARKKKEQYMKELLTKRKEEEEAFTRTNLLKIRDHWREIMRHEKVGSLKKEVEIVCQNYEREADRKDALVNLLMADLGESEEQFQIAVRAHLRHVDDLVGLHQDRVNILEREFQNELSILLEDFNKERTEAMAQHKSEVQELRDIMAAMEEEYNETRNSIVNFHRNNIDELKRHHDEELATISSELRTEVLDLYSRFRNAMDKYNIDTEHRQRKFKTDKKQDKANADTIMKGHRAIKALQNKRDQIKAKMATNDREFQERNHALKEEKESVHRQFKKLKRRMENFRKDEARRLTDLTIHSERAIKKLEGKLEQAEKILGLAEINRKYETEEEKVLPFYKDTDGLDQPEMPDDYKDLKDAVAEGDEPRDISEWEYLNSFYKRYNKVTLDSLALDREKERLAEENENLKTILRQYLDGISVNADVLATQNSLFIVNGSTNFPIPPRPAGEAGAPVPVIEAQTLVVAQRRAY